MRAIERRGVLWRWAVLLLVPGTLVLGGCRKPAAKQEVEPTPVLGVQEEGVSRSDVVLQVSPEGTGEKGSPAGEVTVHPSPTDEAGQPTGVPSSTPVPRSRSGGSGAATSTLVAATESKEQPVPQGNGGGAGTEGEQAPSIDPLTVLGYQLAWHHKLPEGERGGRQEDTSLTLAADGQRVAYRTQEAIHLLNADGVERRIPAGSSQSLLLAPQLDGWYVKQHGVAGKLQAFDSQGNLTWEVEAPPGDLHLSPDGGLLVTHSTSEVAHTTAFGSDGQLRWSIDQLGGQVSFALDGSLFIWDWHRGWQLRSPEGGLRRGANLPAEQNPVLQLSLDGRFLIEPDSGYLHPATTPEQRQAATDGAKPVEVVAFQGPGRLFATNGRDLYLFLKEMGRHSRLEAYDARGQLLWSRPATATDALISHDGRLVFLRAEAGYQVVDGQTGSDLLTLSGVRQLTLAPVGDTLLVDFGDRLAVYRRD